MARSTTSMANIALSYIGDNRISNLDEDTSEAAVTCRLHFDETVEQVLSDPLVDFNCARARVSIAQSVPAPAGGWLYQYELPPDYLRLRKYTDDETDLVNYFYLTPADTASYPFTIEGNFLLSNKDDCYILYQKKITDVSLFPPLLAKAMCVLLASAIATRLGAGKARADELLVAYVNEALPKARAENQITAYVEDEHGVRAWGDAGRW